MLLNVILILPWRVTAKNDKKSVYFTGYGVFFPSFVVSILFTKFSSQVELMSVKLLRLHIMWTFSCCHSESEYKQKKCIIIIWISRGSEILPHWLICYHSYLVYHALFLSPMANTLLICRILCIYAYLMASFTYKKKKGYAYLNWYMCSIRFFGSDLFDRACLLN